MFPVRVAVRLRVCLAQSDRGASLWSLIAYDKYGMSVAIAERLAVGPVILFSGIGARCVRKSPFVRGRPSKNGAGEKFWPVFGP